MNTSAPSIKKRLLAASACAVAFAAMQAGPALADDYTINLDAPATAVVGQPVTIHVSGVNPPPDQWWTQAWIELSVIPTSVTNSCPASDQDGMQMAESTGGMILAIASRPSLDTAGNYYNTMGWTPWAAGSYFVCGYEDDGGGGTLDRAQAVETVSNPSAPAKPAPPTGSAPGGGTAPGGGGPAAKPANTKRPHVTRAGKKLVCDPGQWSGSSGSYRYAWLANGKSRKGATGRSLRITHALHGRKVQCSVTASGAGGTATAVSQALRVR